MAALVMFGATAQAQTAVVVNDGQTVTIPGDHDPADVSSVTIEAGGFLITEDADISGSVGGSGNAIIHANGGDAELNGGTITNSITTREGNALLATGAGATITAFETNLVSHGTSASSGDPSAGAYARNGGLIELTGGTVTTTGDFGYAVRTSGDGAHIEVVDVESIMTSGKQGIGIQAYGNHDAATSTTVSVTNSSVVTEGERGFGIQAARIGAQVGAADTNILTKGKEAFGVIADRGGTVTLMGGSVTTEGDMAHGLFASHREPFTGSREGVSLIEASSLTVTTRGDNSSGVHARGSGIELTDVDIVTEGLWSFGVHAEAATFLESPLTDTLAEAHVTIDGGSIRTINTKGQFEQSGDGSRAYALFAQGEGALIEASNLEIQTLGQRAYGAYAQGGGDIVLNDSTISTDGFMAYGIYASGAGSVITANNLDITTNGQVGDAAWAYDGGVLNLDGGTYIVNGEPNPGKSDESANGLIAFKDGLINANNLTIVTRGSDSAGIKAGAYLGEDGPTFSGLVNFDNGSVTVEGENSVAVLVRFGSEVTLTNSTLVSEQGAGIRTVDDATVTINNSTVIAAQESISAHFGKEGQTQAISVGAGSILTQNNGTLLNVTREGDGSDGLLTFELGASSISQGDVIDSGAGSDGGTDFIVREGAQWSGAFFGIRNFVSEGAAQLTFDDGSTMNGDLNGTGSSYVFGEGVAIGGDVSLLEGTTTTGGSISNPVNVTGDVFVDPTSFFGGNWQITGDVDIQGTMSPGNSPGVNIIDGNLTLNGVYDVDINRLGESDLTIVTGTATLGGTVEATIEDGVVLNSPYTILSAGTISGSFGPTGSWTEDYLFLADPQLSYSGGDVLLTAQRNGLSFASFAETRNQRSVAMAAEYLPQNGDIYNALVTATDPDAARIAYTGLSGEIHGSLRSGLFEDSYFIRRATLERAQTTGSLLTLGGTGGHHGAIWAEGFGSWGESDGDGIASTTDRSIGGVIIGGDVELDGFTRFGVAGGYSSASYDSLHARADADSFHFGAYAGAQFGALGARGGAIYSWHEIDTDRHVLINGFSDYLEADYDGNTTQLFGEIGYSMPSGPVELEPFAGIAWVSVDTDSFSEKGGAASLSADDESDSVSYSTLGVRASLDWNINDIAVTARGLAGWRHAFGKAPALGLSFSGGPEFSVRGAPLAEDSALVELGLDAMLTPNTAIRISYAGQFGDNVSMQGGRVELSARF